MKIEIYARGEPRTGKSFVLVRLAKVLNSYGFETSAVVNIETDVEKLEAMRLEDRSAFITGDRMVQFGDWTFELDKDDVLTKVLFKGMTVHSTEVVIGLSITAQPELTLRGAITE